MPFNMFTCSNRHTAMKQMLEAFHFARTGHDIGWDPPTVKDRTSIHDDMFALEQIAERLPITMIGNLENLFDRMSKTRARQPQGE